MRRSSFALNLLTAVVLAACAAPAEPPTPTPERPSPLPPTPTQLPLPGDVVSATPLPPGVEPPSATPPYAPAPGDEKLQRGNAFVESTEILIAESFPPQFFLKLTGSLPTPCHQLRVNPDPPDAQNQIKVEVYSVVDPSAICTDMLQPFDVNVRLGSFPAGTYEVWVNDQPAGEIESP